ncbi:hypothetical protein FJNA_13550 [Thermus sp. FJN-A]
MPLVVEVFLLLATLVLLALLLRPKPRGLDWARARLRGLVDWGEVERALRSLDRQEEALEEALKAPHLLPETQASLKRALGEVREQRARLFALLESLAAERALAGRDLGAAARLEERLATLRGVLASLREQEG